ncbi:Reticulon [Handroanthus impetiginosus]|uniref:Reticulon-like protein n=1 Tax=Handroanthus impetiginosus TaxID=429701 RepID=A0A2G9G944_9LAMI|nr:Reticulon [Handroanthus impetiginosus]
MSDISESPPSPPKVQLHNDKPGISLSLSLTHSLTHAQHALTGKLFHICTLFFGADIVRELVLWRRKQLNVVILLAATAAWIAMEVYQYNFVTLLSWVAMAFVACFFFWGNIHRLLKKEAPDLSELEISEGTAMGTANLLRQRVEEGIRLMFHVSAEREWLVFAGVVACLYLISVAARYLDFLTLSYIGLVGGLTIPVIYVKYEYKIREFGEKLRTKSQRF